MFVIHLNTNFYIPTCRAKLISAVEPKPKGFLTAASCFYIRQKYYPKKSYTFFKALLQYNIFGLPHYVALELLSLHKFECPPYSYGCRKIKHGHGFVCSSIKSTPSVTKIIQMVQNFKMWDERTDTGTKQHSETVSLLFTFKGSRLKRGMLI